MISLKKTWNSFWFIEGPPHALAIFRILFSAFWLVIWLSWLPHVSLYFSRNGMYFPAFPDPGKNVSGFQTLVGWITRSPSIGQAWLLYGIGAALLSFIMVGFFTRLALIAFFLVLNYHYYVYLHMHGTSFDRLLLLVLILMILSPCGAVLSLDAHIARRKSSSKTIYNLWTQRMICVQIAIIYLATGIHKIITPAWTSGKDLAAAFYGDYATHAGFWIAKMNIPHGVYNLLTVLIIFFELSLSFLLFSRRWQNWAFVFGSIFHILNCIFLWIPQFLVVICCYILFLDPQKAASYFSSYRNINKT
jgi:hypothetical protein